ncbi:MAG: serine/threonine protein kinase [Sphaerospermopsis kisseleviana]
MSMTWELGLLINNRYQIQEIIYQSPFECDYLVTDKNQNDKICILKNFINIKSGEISIIAKLFHQDLNIIKSLEHPQIQKVKDFFWEGEHIFIAQDYTEGQSYQDLLQMRLSLTEEEAIELLKKILPVLSYLHNQQIVHGDISPSNLVLRSYDNLPVLRNFGVMTDILTQLGGETFQNKLLERIKRLSLNITLSDSGEDLYALAMTVVMLLTGQEIEVLFNPQTQTWDWENWKLVSDQFASVLNRMLSVQVMNSFDNA